MLFIGLALLLVKALVAVWNAAVLSGLSWALFAAAALLGILALGMLCLLFPVLSRFENSFLALVKNTVFLAMANLPRTLAIGLIYGMTALLSLRFIAPLFFMPALASLIATLFIEPMFKPFMPEEEKAEE